MKIIIFVLVHIFLVTECMSLMEEKAGNFEQVPEESMPYVVAIIYSSNNPVENHKIHVISGTIISQSAALTVGHETHNILKTRKGRSEEIFYHAHVAVGIDTVHIKEQRKIWSCVLPQSISNYIRVDRIVLFDTNVQKGSSNDLAVVTFNGENKSTNYGTANYATQDILIRGLGYYGVPVITSGIGLHIRGIIKKINFELHPQRVCNEDYHLQIQDYQFCGRSMVGTTLSEVEKGAGLFKDNLLIGVAIYAKDFEFNSAKVEFVIFEKVGRCNLYPPASGY